MSSSKLKFIFPAFLLLIITFAISLNCLFFIDQKYGKTLSRSFSIEALDLHTKPFIDIINSIPNSNAFDSRLNVDNGIISIEVPNFNSVNLSAFYDVSISNDTSITQKAALYAMGYCTNHLITNYQKLGSLKELFDMGIVNDLMKVTKVVIKDLNRLYSQNIFKYNDHVISERVEFLLIFSALLNESNDENGLKKLIGKEINHCICLLLDDSYFSWKTNHGIMQIRSLLLIADMIKPGVIRSRCINKAEYYLDLIISYFIAYDGAVLEGASGYWRYIFKQFSMISKHPLLSSKLKQKLNSRLGKAEYFLRTVYSIDGFVQGLGDNENYSFKVIKPFQYNRIFQFSNGLAGTNFKSMGSVYSFLFISLDTPPNIHKLPEDLAFYFYADQPFFINSGRYSYDNSDEFRKYILSERSQSTVFPPTMKYIPSTSSKIEKVKVKENNQGFSISGAKKYNQKIVQRKIDFQYDKGIIKVTDRSSDFAKLQTNLNIHPDIQIRHENNKLVLVGNKNSIVIESFNDTRIVESWVSMEFNRKTKIKQIQISGNPVKFKISFPIGDLEPFELITSDNLNSFHRFEQATIIEKNLPSKLSLKKSFIIRVIMVGISYFICFVLFKSIHEQRVKSSKLLGYLTIIVIFIWFMDIYNQGHLINAVFNVGIY